MGCFPHTKISIDIRMDTRFAVENLFFGAPKKSRIEKVHLCD